MEDARQRTLRVVEGMSEADVDRPPQALGNSVGTILYHVALIEADWLFADILGPESGRDWPAELFPFEVRDESGALLAVRGVSLADHLARLQATRAMLLEYLGTMSGDEFARARSREDYDVSPAWVIHHLLQHEAEHRDQIAALLGHPAG
jgi:uncharacterized damage-inducible protein DinB